MRWWMEMTRQCSGSHHVQTHTERDILAFLAVELASFVSRGCNATVWQAERLRARQYDATRSVDVWRALLIRRWRWGEVRIMNIQLMLVRRTCRPRRLRQMTHRRDRTSDPPTGLRRAVPSCRALVAPRFVLEDKHSFPKRPSSCVEQETTSTAASLYANSLPSSDIVSARPRSRTLRSPTARRRPRCASECLALAASNPIPTETITTSNHHRTKRPPPPSRIVHPP